MSDFHGTALVIITLCLFLPLLFNKKIRTSKLWHATVTPLASIIGSGFLVSAPLVVLTTGKWAPLAMLSIVIIAYLLGSVMRFNIFFLEPYLIKGRQSKFIIPLEMMSRPTLGIAYMISVAFYLKLLSVFILKGLNSHTVVMENLLTTSILIFIGLVGWFKDLHMLEILEKYAVNLKLAIIGALVVSFYAFNIFSFDIGKWTLTEHSLYTPWESFRRLLGILIIIQGFETSRYMGELYSQERRMKSMKYAQLISGFVYVTFVASAMILFNDITTIRETAIIDLCRLISPLMPPLLILAAIMSQFSAAVADSIGSSGLLSESTRQFITPKQGVLITVIIAIALIWLTNVFEIIVIASKAFAIYYGMQTLIAFRLALRRQKIARSMGFLGLFILMALVVLLGIPVES